MKESKGSIYIEEMNGFDRVLDNLDIIYGCELIYGSMQHLLEGQIATANIVGVVKGPRTKFTTLTFTQIASLMPAPIIGYIGRHPEKILNNDVTYKQETVGGKRILIVQAGKYEVPLLPMDNSPLSDAVAAYVIGMTDAVLHNQEDILKQLSIAGGNIFSIRDSHPFSDIVNKQQFDGITVGVVGVGDIGQRVIQRFHEGGANVHYTARSPKKLGSDIRYHPSAKSVMQKPVEATGPYVVSLHLPKDATVSLKDAEGIDILVNTGSGFNIDELELIKALDEGRIRHAIIDVFKKEGREFNDDILNRHTHDPRITLTPHIAYNQPQAIRETLEKAIDNIMQFRQEVKQ